MTVTSGAFEIDGFVQQQKELEAMLMSNPAMEKEVQKLIRKVLMQARRDIGKDAKDAMDADPRQAYKAVKSAVYRQILGGNVSLYRKKRSSKSGGSYEPPRTLTPGQRGGNRRQRSLRTTQLQSYMGSDRSFVLRWLDGGTHDRFIAFTSDPHRSRVKRGSQGGNVQKYGKTTNTGRRGHIAPRNFFGSSSQQAMSKAAGELTVLIDKLIKQHKI